MEELARQTPATMTRESLTEVVTEVSVLDDRIRVQMAGSEVTDVRLHLSTLRMGVADLGRHLTEAFNQAQREHAEAVAAALVADDTDFGRMAHRVSALREEANRAMNQCLSGLTDTLLQGRQR